MEASVRRPLVHSRVKVAAKTVVDLVDGVRRLDLRRVTRVRLVPEVLPSLGLQHLSIESMRD